MHYNDPENSDIQVLAKSADADQTEPDHEKVCFMPYAKNKGTNQHGERGGSVVECRTPEREVGGSKPTAAMLCP